MSAAVESTASPTVLAPELVQAIHAQHIEIVRSAPSEKIETGNAKYAVCRPARIPPWVEQDTAKK